MKFLKEKMTEKITLGIILLIVIAAIFVFTAKEQQPVATLLQDDAVPAAAVPADNSGIAALEKSIEDKITANLEKMHGVGKSKVMVTYSTGVKKEYARDESITKRTSKETDKQGGVRETVEVTENNKIIIAGNTNPLVVVEERPPIAGVLVIAQGANDPKIKEQIFEAVRTLLDVPASKISVMPMGGD